MKKRLNLKYIFYGIVFVLGISMTIFYIFHTATLSLTSDSVISDVMLYQHLINKHLLLSNWYYGSSFNLFSINIFTVICQFFLKNNLIIRHISILLMGIVFFIILYKYGKKFLSKEETIIFILIFLTGVSYSVLDYFYSYNSYLVMVVNSLLLLYLYFKSFESKNSKIIYYILALSLTLLWGIDNYKYLIMITLPFMLAELFLKKKQQLKKLGGLLGVVLISVVAIFVLEHQYQFHEEHDYQIVSNKFYILDKVRALFDISINFFGYDNRNNVNSALAGEQYFVATNETYSIVSARGIADFIKAAASIIFLIITPIMLYKNYRKNDSKINFLLIFNTISWLIMIFYYFILNNYIYPVMSLKYFLFNFILSILLGIYFLSKYFAKTKLCNLLYYLFIVSYLLSNIYYFNLTNNYDKDQEKEKFRLVKVLKAHNLTFGYGSYYNSLLTSYLSNYQITVANVKYESNIIKYKLYSDKKWYKHTGKVFFIIDENNLKYIKKYKKRYGRPNKVYTFQGFTVYVYDKNPLLTTSL